MGAAINHEPQIDDDLRANQAGFQPTPVQDLGKVALEASAQPATEAQTRVRDAASLREQLLGGLDMSWQKQASCLGTHPDLFFPKSGVSHKEAKAVCQSCPVRQDCLDFAIVAGEEFGIWGGLNGKQRQRVRRARPKPEEPSQTKINQLTDVGIFLAGEPAQLASSGGKPVV